MSAVPSLTPLTPSRAKPSSGAASAAEVQAENDTPMRIVIVGHVDHGKSTLIGRLFHDTGSLPEGKVEAIQASCAARGVPFEWAFLMDAFKAERDQNITIDTAQIWFRTEARSYVIIDAPGHREFLKNMVTGAASADAAVLVVAADEGVSDQSRRHAYLLSLLGVRRVLVAVNKIDLVDDPAQALTEIETELGAFMRDLDLAPEAFIPVSARDGDNIVTATDRTAFSSGPTLVDALDTLGQTENEAGPLRFPVQDIYRFDHRRIIAGRIESGSVAVGDTLEFHPGGRRANVKSIEGWAAAPSDHASAGQSVGLVLDEQLFLERGHVATVVGQSAAPIVTEALTARVFWMGHAPLEEGQRIKIKLVTQEAFATVSAVEFALDSSSLATDHDATKVDRDEVAQVRLTLDRPLALDRASEIATLGRFVFVDNYDVVGGGLVLDADALAADEGADEESDAVSVRERARKLGHDPHLVVFEGATSYALGQLERALFAQGHSAVAVPARAVDAAADVTAALLRAGHIVLIDTEITDGRVHKAASSTVLITQESNGFSLRSSTADAPQTPASLSAVADTLLRFWTKDARRSKTQASPNASAQGARS